MDGAKRTLGYYPRVSAVLPEKSKFHRKSYLPNSAMFVVLCCSTLVLHSVYVVHNQHAEQKHLVLFFIYRWLKSQHSVLFRGFFFWGGGFIEFMLQWMASQKTKKQKERKKEKEWQALDVYNWKENWEWRQHIHCWEMLQKGWGSCSRAPSLTLIQEGQVQEIFNTTCHHALISSRWHLVGIY